LGAASELRTASRGHERAFLASLRDRVPQGWVVALGHEFGVALLGGDPLPDDEAPAFALRLDVVLVLDHERGVAELRGSSHCAIDAWLDRFGPALTAVSTGREASSDSGGTEAAGSAAPATWRHGADDYARQVEACRSFIRDGDAYVLCLTDTAEISCDGIDPCALYAQLRETTPAIRGGIIGAAGRLLLSASPERFLSVENGEVTTRPIKGTRPRGGTPTADAQLADELRNDPKERAENLMIVDLMRNDLSRVCDPATVAVSGFLQVETHPRVHQLVSTVSGRLRPGFDVIDVIAACFPGGSMTGAPKRRAVELLAALEGRPRGLYGGCFGWIDAQGNAELAMTIRSIEIRGGYRATVGAGGGITADSDPSREHQEKLLKAAPLFDALRSARS